MEVVANNHFIWNGKEWMGGLRKGKLIAGGYWVFGGLRSVKKFLAGILIENGAFKKPPVHLTGRNSLGPNQG